MSLPKNLLQKWELYEKHICNRHLLTIICNIHMQALQLQCCITQHERKQQHLHKLLGTLCTQTVWKYWKDTVLA